jgi:hypothetical protein
LTRKSKKSSNICRTHLSECIVQSISLLTTHRDDDEDEEIGDDVKPKEVEEAKEGNKAKFIDQYSFRPDGWINFDPEIEERTASLHREEVHRILTTRLRNIIRTY